MSGTRFSKSACLAVLDARASSIADREKFNRSHGTRQMNPTGAHDELVRRAVEYGRMRAYEDFACAIEEGFRFDATPVVQRWADKPAVTEEQIEVALKARDELSARVNRWVPSREGQ